MLIAYIHPQVHSLMFLPLISDVRKTLYDQFITEKIYSVIFRKNFIDPTEFKEYMSCYEEVFETTSDQNTNLNSRIKDDKTIINLLTDINSYIENSYSKLDEFTNILLQIKEKCDKYSEIDFVLLKEEGKSEQFKTYLKNFITESGEIKKLREKNFIGLFEYHLHNFIDNVKDLPDQLISKMRELIPEVLIKKLRDLIVELNSHFKVICFT